EGASSGLGAEGRGPPFRVTIRSGDADGEPCAAAAFHMARPGCGSDPRGAAGFGAGGAWAALSEAVDDALPSAAASRSAIWRIIGLARCRSISTRADCRGSAPGCARSDAVAGDARVS